MEAHSKSKLTLQTIKIDSITRDTARHKIFNNKYKVLKLIGEGSFGKVKQVERVTDQKMFAMKVFDQGVLRSKKEYINAGKGLTVKTALEDALSELNVLQQLNHKNVTMLHEMLEDKSTEKIYVIMDLCENGEVVVWSEKLLQFSVFAQSKSKVFTEEQLKAFYMQALNGLEYLHSLNIVHRDISTTNLMCTADHTIKIGDFGKSKKLASPTDRLVGSAGTYHFMAPEAISDKNGKGYSGQTADVWSLGVVFYSWAFLRLPFYNDSIVELFNTIEHGKFEFPADSKYSKGLHDFLKMILNPKYQERPPISKIKQNAWLTSQMYKLPCIKFNQTKLWLCLIVKCFNLRHVHNISIRLHIL